MCVLAFFWGYRIVLASSKYIHTNTHIYTIRTHQAKVHPAAKGNSLSDSQLESIYNAVLDVCGTAVAANADKSKFPKNWIFHVRWGKGKKRKHAPKLPNGNPVSFVTVGGRTSAVVVKEQKMGKRVKKKEKTKSKSTEARKSSKGTKDATAKRKSKRSRQS